jgi:ATP:corrinoid adenosyltransferase
LDKIDSIEKDKQDIEDYNKYIKAWKKYMAIDEDMSLLLPDELLILSKFDFTDPEYLKNLAINYPLLYF